MILAFSHIYLCEVETEEQAFAEMRRYLEVNDLSSNTTTIRIKNTDEVCYKSIVLGYAPHTARYGSATDTGRVGNFNLYSKGGPSDSNALDRYLIQDNHYLKIETCRLGRELLGCNYSHQCKDDMAVKVAQCVANYMRDIKARKETGCFPLFFDCKRG